MVDFRGARLAAIGVFCDRWGGDPFSGARVVSVAHFEPAAGMQGEALDSYKRRFGTLFVDESTRRRGGIGSVVRATNAWRAVRAENARYTRAR